jgi:Domain of unknown function (DUF4271)
LKQAYFFVLFLLPVCLFAQVTAIDSVVVQQPLDTIDTVKDSAKAQQPDSVTLSSDTLSKPQLPKNTDRYSPAMQKAIDRNVLINAKPKPVVTISTRRQPPVQDLYFYTILGLVLLLAFLRFFYSRYFNNLFQVFFNTSLRQSQLTDQLLQAKQASLLFNLFFALTGGLYVFFLIQYFGKIPLANPLLLMLTCVSVLAAIYFLKFISMKITGWLTGSRSAANTYLFIIFLINKILSVLLLPFVIVMAFGAPFLQFPAIVLSLMLIALMFFLRFVRSYILLQQQVRVSRLHFFMYILGVELLPLLLIYKALMILLNKNL